MSGRQAPVEGEWAFLSGLGDGAPSAASMAPSSTLEPGEAFPARFCDRARPGPSFKISLNDVGTGGEHLDGDPFFFKRSSSGDDTPMLSARSSVDSSMSLDASLNADSLDSLASLVTSRDSSSQPAGAAVNISSPLRYLVTPDLQLDHQGSPLNTPAGGLAIDHAVRAVVDTAAAATTAAAVGSRPPRDVVWDEVGELVPELVTVRAPSISTSSTSASTAAAVAATAAAGPTDMEQQDEFEDRMLTLARRRGRRDAVVHGTPPVFPMGIPSCGPSDAGSFSAWQATAWGADPAAPTAPDADSLAQDLTDMAICREILGGGGPAADARTACWHCKKQFASASKCRLHERNHKGEAGGPHQPQQHPGFEQGFRRRSGVRSGLDSQHGGGFARRPVGLGELPQTKL